MPELQINKFYTDNDDNMLGDYLGTDKYPRLLLLITFLFLNTQIIPEAF